MEYYLAIKKNELMPFLSNVDRRYLGGGNGNSLQYSCRENALDRGAWPATLHRVAKSKTQLKLLRLNMNLHEPATAAAKSLQLCPTLCDPIDGGPPGSPVPGILQARTLEWVAISFSSA